MLRHVSVAKGKEVGLTLSGVFDGGEGGDSHGLVVGFKEYVEQGEARGVRVPRAEVQRLDPPCDDDAVRDVVLGEEALGHEHCRAAAVEGVGVGLWKVV